MHSVRNAVITVDISYTGLQEDIGLVGKGLPNRLQVEVRDAGKRLRSYRQDPPALSIDLAAQVNNPDGTIRISSDILRRSVADLLQGTSKLVQVYPEQIVCSYYHLEEKKVPIEWHGEMTLADEYQLVGKPTLSIDSISIYGKKDCIDTIARIYTAPVSFYQIRDSITRHMPLRAPAGVHLSQDSVSLRIITERYTEKVITVPLSVVGVPAGQSIRLFPQEVEVTIRVGISHFATITVQDIVAQCHYPTPNEEKLSVELLYYSPYITAARAYPNEVEFIIEQNANYEQDTDGRSTDSIPADQR